MEVSSSVDDKNGDVDADVGLVVLRCLRSMELSCTVDESGQQQVSRRCGWLGGEKLRRAG